MRTIKLALAALVLSASSGCAVWDVYGTGFKCMARGTNAVVAEEQAKMLARYNVSVPTSTTEAK